jgi:hypothetical protein
VTEVVQVLDRLLPHAPDVPEPVAVRAYIDAARHFFTRSRAWRTEDGVLSPVTRGEYALDVGAGIECFDASDVSYDGYPLTKVGAEPRRVRSTGRPEAYRVLPGKMFIYPAPVDEERVKLRFIVRPARDATGIPDEVDARFGDIIESGALARLLMQPGQPWSNPEYAGVYAAAFDAQIDEWSVLGADSGTTGVHRRVRYGGL